MSRAAHPAVPDDRSPKVLAGDLSTGPGVALAVMVGGSRPLRAEIGGILEGGWAGARGG